MPQPLPKTAPTDRQSDRTALADRRPDRLLSMDAYRGFVMVLMVAELLQFHRLHKAFPNSGFWAFLSHHQSHAEWAGCTLHDLIQPSFSFLVGVALPYSIASRSAQGQSFGTQAGHAFRRSLILVLLGIFLRSTHADQTNFTFEDTLTQIGLGYPFLFLLGYRSPKTGWLAAGLILFAYWLAFVLYPLPGPAFSDASVGVPSEPASLNWPELNTGLTAHFNKNRNLAWAFDTVFLNLFPRESPFRFNAGGYATLSFVPTLGTMLLGLAVGRWLRSGIAAPVLLKRLLLAGVLGLAGGLFLHLTGICPVVKRIWTPAWVLFSGGWCCWLLAVFYRVTDMAGPLQRIGRIWTFPLVVVGMNSITIYCLAHLVDRFIIDALFTHLGHGPFRLFGPAYEPLLVGIATMGIFYDLLLWMYRRHLFIRI